MGRSTGVLLIILGVWLLVATVAGRLPERILSLVADRPGGFVAAGPPSDPAGGGGGFSGPSDETGSGSGGGGGGAW